MGILWGTAGAIVLRVILIFFALTLLQIPYLKIVGAVLLLWIGVKLLLPEHDEAHGNIQASDKLWARGEDGDRRRLRDEPGQRHRHRRRGRRRRRRPPDAAGDLRPAGQSIPIIVWGSQLVIKLMDRFPVIITLGGMLLGWIAGQMVISDPVLKDWADGRARYLHYAGAGGRRAVRAAGRQVAGRARARRACPRRGARRGCGAAGPAAARAAGGGRLRGARRRPCAT